MTPREPERPLRTTLRAPYDALRRALRTRHALRATAAGALALALVVIAGALLPVVPATAWGRLLALAATWAVAIAIAVRSVRAATPGFDSWLERAESRFPEIRSWLRNALDLERRPAANTSAELSRAVTDETARRLAGVPLRTLTPPVEPRRPALAIAVALAALATLALLWPAPAARSWETLWNPSAAAPPVTLQVEPGSVKVTPGAALAVRARVWGTRERPRLLRDGAAKLDATLEGDGRSGERLWRFDLTQLTREQDYRVRVAGEESPRYRIALAGEPQPVSFEIEYRAPAYARLPVQRGAATRGDLSALRGTRAALEVTFDRDLESLTARLPGGGASTWEEVTPRRWRGVVPVDREGDWELLARAASGQAAHRYRVTPLADAPPVIAVRTPEGDLDLPAGQQVPLDVRVEDDLGLAELRLQWRKDPEAPWSAVPLARFGGAREADVARRWDASIVGLLPGQSASFRLEVSDGARGVATSPAFELRFPGVADLYERIDDRQQDVQGTLEKVAEQAKELQKSLDKMSRQPPRTAGENAQSFERREELQKALERQQDIGRKLDEAAESLRQSLDQAAERKAFDEQLTRKLREMAELMDQIQSKEFRDALKKMQEAMENLDRRALEQNLPEWRQQNQDMMKNLERTVELLKQLRREERLQALAQRAEELKARQDELNRANEKQDAAAKEQREAEAKALAEQQKQAAEESEKLAKEAREAGQDPDQKAEKQSLEQAAEELEQQAAPSQREASQAQQQQQQQRARKSGRKASESLEKAAKQLSQMAQQSQNQRETADLAAVRRAAQDLVSLQRGSEGNLDAAGTPKERADRQTDLSEGTARVADSLYTLSEKSPFISPKLGASLGRAIQQLMNSGRDLAQGNRARGEEQGRAGSQALNEAVIELRKAESSMCQKPGMGTPKPSGAGQRMGQLGQQQGQLNEQSRSLSQRLSQQMRLSAGDRGEMQRLAEEQQRIREQLEQIQKEEGRESKLLGRLDQVQREMKEVEEALERGSTGGPVEEKQQRILSRLLDAQRSVNRRDFDPERESRVGEEVPRSSPAELPADLLRERDRTRLDLLKADADRYPAQYRAFIEAYLRSLNGSRR